MKHLLIVAALLLLTSCDEHEDAEPVASESQEIQMEMPVGLKDCRTFLVQGIGKTMLDRYSMLVTRCPHSVTTTEAGGKTAVVAESEEELDPEVVMPPPAK